MLGDRGRQRRNARGSAWCRAAWKTMPSVRAGTEADPVLSQKNFRERDRSTRSLPSTTRRVRCRSHHDEAVGERRRAQRLNWLVRLHRDDSASGVPRTAHRSCQTAAID
jgi:hypothetical protein